MRPLKDATCVRACSCACVCTTVWYVCVRSPPRRETPSVSHLLVYVFAYAGGGVHMCSSIHGLVNTAIVWSGMRMMRVCPAHQRALALFGLTGIRGYRMRTAVYTRTAPPQLYSMGAHLFHRVKQLCAVSTHNQLPQRPSLFKSKHWCCCIDCPHSSSLVMHTSSKRTCCLLSVELEWILTSAL